MLKLKLQYFGHLMRRADWFEKTLMMGKIEGRRRRGRQRMRWLDDITDTMDMGLGGLWWTGRPGVLWFMVSQRVRHNWATELNWTEYYSPGDNFSENWGTVPKRSRESQGIWDFYFFFFKFIFGCVGSSLPWRHYSSCSKQGGYCLISALRLLIKVASLAVEQGL